MEFSIHFLEHFYPKKQSNGERETHEKKKRKREIRERHFNRRREEGKREI